jgi:transcriptional regulator with XRE-family HTH domain
MRRRGRPPKITVRRYPNQLRSLRERLGLSQEKVAGAAGISIAYYGALERGDRRINADTARRLQPVLRCGVGNLLLQASDAGAIPLRIAIAAVDSEDRPLQYDLPSPHEWLQAPRLTDVNDCFAAEIFDDSADRDFPKGTILVVRQFTDVPAALRSGAKVVVRFRLSPIQSEVPPATHEILYGTLDRNVQGDLLLATRTRNRLVPRQTLIQSLPAAAAPGLGERPFVSAPRDGVFAYLPRPDDSAEILGLVIYSMGPE